MKTIYDTEFKASRALGAYVPFGNETSAPVNWTDWADGATVGKGYSKNAIVYTCVHEIATSASSVPFMVVEKATGNRDNSQAAISKILANPNPMQDRATFWECVYGFYILKGNVGIEAAPYQGAVVNEMYCIPFDLVTIKLNQRGMVNRYIVNPYRSEEKVFQVSSITGRSKLMHLRTFNPDNLWMGISPLEAAGRDADIFYKSGEWNGALLANSARPSGVFSYDDKEGGILTDDAYDRLKTEIKTEYVGAQNAGVPILLEGGLRWQGISLSPSEMDFLNSRAASARVVASAFGYPAMLLGLSGDNTYNNQKEARLGLWTDTIMPLCDKVGTQLTDFFAKLDMLDGNRLQIVPDYENIGALQPIRDAIWEKACVKGKDILTINERREMIGKKKMTGYDGIIANAAQVPLDYALTNPKDRAPVTIIRDNTTKTPNKDAE